MIAGAAVLVAGLTVILVGPGWLTARAGAGVAAPPAGAGGNPVHGSTAALRSQGRRLFVSGCSSCHGFQAAGIKGVAPDLHGVGASAADFYLTTGLMPLSAPGQQPFNAQPRYDAAQIAALDAYVGSFGGPGIPRVRTTGVSLSHGQALFADNCSGCHQIVARGGMVTGAFVPSLVSVTPTQIAEAVRTGPYLMPRFGPGELSGREIDEIARFVLTTRHPDDRGGFGIGYIGPVPEGMITWFLAIPLLLLATRLIGHRSER